MYAHRGVGSLIREEQKGELVHQEQNIYTFSNENITGSRQYDSPQS